MVMQGRINWTYRHDYIPLTHPLNSWTSRLESKWGWVAISAFIFSTTSGGSFRYETCQDPTGQVRGALKDTAGPMGLPGAAPIFNA